MGNAAREGKELKRELKKNDSVLRGIDDCQLEESYTIGLLTVLASEALHGEHEAVM